MRSACKANFDLLVKAVIERKRKMNPRLNSVISSRGRGREGPHPPISILKATLLHLH